MKLSAKTATPEFTTKLKTIKLNLILNMTNEIGSKSELSQFTETIIKMKQFEEKNNEIFGEYKMLIEEKNNAEKQLKEWSLANGDAENAYCKVQRIARWKKWWDFGILKADKKTFKLIKDNGGVIITEEIDKEVVEKLAKEEKIDRQLLRNAYREEKMSDAIKITIL